MHTDQMTLADLVRELAATPEVAGAIEASATTFSCSGAAAGCRPIGRGHRDDTRGGEERERTGREHR